MARWGRAAAAVLAVVLAGCVAPPAGEYDPVEADASSRLQDGDLELRQQGLERQMHEATLRVRNRTCFGTGSGSGFALTDRVLVTNRHVVAGADVVQLSTWDGHSVDVVVNGVAATDDLALVLTETPMTATLELADGAPPGPGTRVAAVGYPNGEAIELAWGEVVDTVPGVVFGGTHRVLRVTAKVIPGNSGGPLLDEDGRVVGVVFAIEKATGYGLAITIGALTSMIETAGIYANPSPC